MREIYNLLYEKPYSERRIYYDGICGICTGDAICAVCCCCDGGSCVLRRPVQEQDHGGKTNYE